MRIVATVLILSSITSAAEPALQRRGRSASGRGRTVSWSPPARSSGQPTCFICEQEDKPTAVVFARSLSEPLGTLLQKLDGETAKRKDFKAWLTLLTPTADLDALSKWSTKQGLKSVPVGAFEDADGPPAYTLHKDADVTVMVFVKKKVLVNRAWRSGELTAEAADAMMADVRKAFGN